MEVYYKGEDISMTIGLFADKKMLTPIKLSDYIVDLLLYNDGDTNEVYCSAEASSESALITNVDDYTFKVVIPFALLELLRTGQIILEVRLADKIERAKKIKKALPFILEDSRIKRR